MMFRVTTINSCGEERYVGLIDVGTEDRYGHSCPGGLSVQAVAEESTETEHDVCPGTVAP